MSATAQPAPDISAEVRSFIQFCRDRLSPQDQNDWGRLYDSMCYVAAHRLYQNWDYGELAARGASLGLHNLARLRAAIGGAPPGALPHRR